eukprot:jgi/Hompol1/346/HPOL_002885-RA
MKPGIDVNLLWLRSLFKIHQYHSVLVNSDRRTNLTVHVANDGVVYKNDVYKLFHTLREDGREPAVLLLIPLRLGVDSMNPIYHPAIKQCFGIKHCVGIAGGRPNSSLFFLGNDGDNLIYLDPHYQRPCVELRDITSYEMEDLLSYHCETVRLMPIRSLDPSLVIGFYCASLSDFDTLCSQLVQLFSLTHCSTPLFSLELSPPQFNPDVDDIVSEDDFQ